MIIDYRKLSAKALRGVIEEFVTRDGTEQTDVETKIAQVRRQLEQGKAVIIFDPETRSCTISPTDTGAPRDA